MKGVEMLMASERILACGRPDYTRFRGRDECRLNSGDLILAPRIRAPPAAPAGGEEERENAERYVFEQHVDHREAPAGHVGRRTAGASRTHPGGPRPGGR